MLEALLLAAFLNRSPVLVQQVYAAGGLDAVALVECESNFNPQAVRREPRGHSSYGLFQLDNEWHKQWQGDLSRHIATGAAFLAECKARKKTLAEAVRLYNGSYQWGRRVEAKRDELVRWLRWREIREMECVR